LNLSSEESFAKRWPEFFRDVSCGYDIPDEWERVLWHLCAAIEWELRRASRPLTDLKISQIKNKFGGLRFYYTVVGSDNELDRVVRAIHKLVEDAENIAYSITKNAREEK